ncbi:hypothetical protein ACVU7I_16520, partial [Patulibacter sp. S7RM1-6]
MIRRIPRIRRPRAAGAALLALAAAALGTGLGTDADVRAQTAAGPVGIESQIGPESGAQLLGAAAGGETWAVTTEDGSSRVPKTVDGAELPEARQYLLRYRPDEGWRYVQTPRDERGDAYAGTIAAGRVTARGGLLLGGEDEARPDGERRVVMARDAVGPTRVLP